MVLHVEGRLNVAADALSRDNLSLFRYHVPDAHPSPTQGAGGVAGNSAARLDLQKLEETVQFYFTKGLAQSTLRTYRSGKDRYLKFCSQAILNPLPVSEQVLCSFVSHLAQQGLKHRTIKVYLSAVRHLQIAGNYPDPFGGSPMPKLEYVLRGVKKDEAEKGEGQRSRLPITPEILRRLKSQWEPTAHTWDTRMVWAACCLGFFAFLRVGEFTVPDNASYDQSVHLSFADIALDDLKNPTVLQVCIKQSKTDPFRKGVTLYVGRTGVDLCPVAAVLSYLELRGCRPGPLFLFQSWKPLTRPRFVAVVREALEKAGLDERKYCSHSFRIGAATTAASRGMEDCIIKTLGRWESVAYLQYVRIPRERLASISGVLAA